MAHFSLTAVSLALHLIQSIPHSLCISYVGQHKQAYGTQADPQGWQEQPKALVQSTQAQSEFIPPYQHRQFASKLHEAWQDWPGADRQHLKENQSRQPNRSTDAHQAHSQGSHRFTDERQGPVQRRVQGVVRKTPHLWPSRRRLRSPPSYYSCSTWQHRNFSSVKVRGEVAVA